MKGTTGIAPIAAPGASPRDVLRRSGSTFAWAFALLPAAEREALEAVYAFCRLVDDAVDEAPSRARAEEGLSQLRSMLERVLATPRADGATRPVAPPRPPPRTVEAALAHAVSRFGLPRAPFHAIVDGCASDVARARFATFAKTRAYCEQVASAPGLLCVRILGDAGDAAARYARDLGVALQLVNVLRDLGEDAARGRLYLPLADLADFGVDERDLLAGRRAAPITRLLRFEAGRARLLAARARAALTATGRARLAPAEVMGDLYLALLDEIEARGFPHDRRVELSPAHKAALVLGRLAHPRVAASLAARFIHE